MPKALSRKPKAHDQPPGPSAYLAGLTMLGRRELSESQVRQRLARKGYDQDDIETAVARLKDERAIDDARVAAALARTATSVKRRGRLRVKQEMIRAGIASSTARAAIEDVFADVDDDALIESALAKRLRYGRQIADDREFNRLYRYLVAQGFESERALKVLTARRRGK